MINQLLNSLSDVFGSEGFQGFEGLSYEGIDGRSR